MTSDQKPSVQNKILANKIEILYCQLPATLISHAAAAIIVMGYISIYLYRSPLSFTWLFVFLLCLLLRGLNLKFYFYSKGKADNPGRWLYLYMLGSGFTGLIWGLSLFFLIPPDSLYHFSFLVIWLIATMAAPVAQLAIILPIFFVYSLSIILPITIYMFISEMPELHIMNIGLVIFFLFLVYTAYRTSQILTQTLELQYENIELVNKLQDEKDKAQILNNKLGIDIEKRITIENELREAKTKTEELAEKMMTLSTLDGLTGIANRRRFDEFFNNEWGRSVRTESSLSLIICDIDNFKLYNDYYGHQKGDQCLCLVAHLLEDYSRRGGDMAARYGGEEFVITLPDTDIGSASQIAEQIRIAIEDLDIPHEVSQISSHVTCSFGVATMIPRQNTSNSILINLADQALYKAKSGGKNRVIITQDKRG